MTFPKAVAIGDPGDVQRATYVESADPPLKRKKNDRQPSAKPTQQSLPLPPRGATRETDDKPNAGRAIKPASGIATGMASLAVVLGLFLAAAWAVRRGMPAGPAKLPGEVVEVLGRTPLTGRQFAHLIRCGNKLLLVYLGPGSAETLTEITDPVEVDRLAGLCRQAHPHSATTSFRQVFQQFSREKK